MLSNLESLFDMVSDLASIVINTLMNPVLLWLIKTVCSYAELFFPSPWSSNNMQSYKLCLFRHQRPLFFCLSFVFCCLINGNEFLLVVHFCCLWKPKCMLMSYVCLHKLFCQNILLFAYWALIGRAYKHHSQSELNKRLTEWLNVYCLLITLRSRNPERGFFFFPSPPSSFASSSPLLASTDFSDSASESTSFTKSASSLPGCSECWTEGPASAYALVFKLKKWNKLIPVKLFYVICQER